VVIRAQLMLNLGPIRKQWDFFTLMRISNHSSSRLQMSTKRLCFCLGLLVCLSYLSVGKIIKKVVDKFS